MWRKQILSKKNNFFKEFINYLNCVKYKIYSPFTIIVESIITQNKITKPISRRQDKRQTRIRLIHLVSIFSHSYSINNFHSSPLFFVGENHKERHLKYYKKNMYPPLKCIIIKKKICRPLAYSSFIYVHKNLFIVKLYIFKIFHTE